MPQTASGALRKTRIKSRQAKARIFRNMAAAAMSAKEARTLSSSPASSLCPKRMENRAPLPMHSPRRMEVRNVISVKEEPTAARASVPRNFPTIRVSATL